MKIIKLIKHFSLILPFLALTKTISAAPEIGKIYETQVQPDIVYRTAQQSLDGTIEEIDLKMDLYLPLGVNGKSPLIIFIHGGNFTAGSKDSAYAVDISTALAQRGAVVANIDYRLEKLEKKTWQGTQPALTPIHNDPRFAELVELAVQAGNEGYYEHPNGVVAALEDTLYAYDFLIDNAYQYSIDTRRVGIWGYSAGAVTAAHFAYLLNDFDIASPDIQAITMLSGFNGIADYTGVNYVQAGEASVFQFHGDKDTTAPLFPYGYNVYELASGVVDATHMVIGKGIGHGTAARIFSTISSNGKTVFENALEFNANALYFPGTNPSTLCEVVKSTQGSNCSQYPAIP